MELSSTEVFVEILIEGVLYAIALSPLINLVSPRARAIGDFFPEFFLRPESIARGVLGVAILYTLGIAFNRIAEQVLLLVPREVHEHIVQNEFWLRAGGREATAADWIERHKTYLKILRGGVTSSAVFIFTMTIYQSIRVCRDRSKRQGQPERYPARYNFYHYAAAVALLALFLLTYFLELYHYDCHGKIFVAALKGSEPEKLPACLPKWSFVYDWWR